MVNVIGKLTQVKPNDLLTNQIGKYFNLNTLSERKNIGEDSVDISQERNLDYLRVEAGVLKNELPGIIANALLKPLSEGIVKEDPLNSILSRLRQLNKNAEQSNTLNGILNSISNELTGLDSFIQKSL